MPFFLMMPRAERLERIKKALKGKQIQKIEAVIHIDGPGTMLVLYSTLGDVCIANLDEDFNVLWNHSA